MFYDRYAELCAEKGISPSKAAEENGLSRMTVSRWRQGATPNADILASLSSYFNVSTDYLLGVDESGTVAFGNKLKCVLADKRMSCHELSEKTGLSLNYIMGIIQGRRNPRLDKIKLIAECLSVTASYLLGVEPEQKEKEKAPALTKKDERDISKKLEETLNQLESSQDGLMFDGEPMDDITRELLLTSLKNSMEMGKKIAKQKYTPKKYR